MECSTKQYMRENGTHHTHDTFFTPNTTQHVLSACLAMRICAVASRLACLFAARVSWMRLCAKHKLTAYSVFTHTMQRCSTAVQSNYYTYIRYSIRVAHGPPGSKWENVYNCLDDKKILCTKSLKNIHQILKNGKSSKIDKKNY